jgi:WD40 repeat protein
MPKPTVNPARPWNFAASAAAFVVTWLIAFASSNGSADEPVLNEPIEFETAPSALLRDSVDVLSVTVGANGKYLFAAFYDGSVMTLDRESRKPIRLVTCHDGPVSDLAVANSGELLVTAGFDGLVKGLVEVSGMRLRLGSGSRILQRWGSHGEGQRAGGESRPSRARRAPGELITT